MLLALVGHKGLLYTGDGFKSLMNPGVKNDETSIRYLAGECKSEGSVAQNNRMIALVSLVTLRNAGLDLIQGSVGVAIKTATR
jgi:hypothetical protein